MRGLTRYPDSDRELLIRVPEDTFGWENSSKSEFSTGHLTHLVTGNTDEFKNSCLDDFNFCSTDCAGLVGRRDMRIKNILSQHRRDFTAIYECESCGYESKGYGYDDSNFHMNVIPNMECKGCGEKSPGDYRALATKHPDSAVI